jgi:putative FmdB family regulatory protein
MPLYEYHCQNDHDFEKLVSMSTPEDEKENALCPVCGETAKRQISKGSFVLKGKWFKSGGY